MWDSTLRNDTEAHHADISAWGWDWGDRCSHRDQAFWPQCCECIGKQHLVIFLVVFNVCVCVWILLWLCEFAPGVGRPSLGIIMLCFISLKIPQLTYFPIMVSSSQRIVWLKTDTFLDKNSNIVNQGISNCFHFNFAWFFFFNFLFFLFFLLQPYLQHMEIPRLGVKLELQLQPTPEPQQQWIWAASVTYATAFGNARPLIYWARPEIKPESSQRPCWVLNPLSHNGTPTLYDFWRKLGCPLYWML